MTKRVPSARNLIAALAPFTSGSLALTSDLLVRRTDDAVAGARSPSARSVVVAAPVSPLAPAAPESVGLASTIGSSPDAREEPALARTTAAPLSTTNDDARAAQAAPSKAKARRGLILGTVGLTATALVALGATKLVSALRRPTVMHCVEMNPSRTGPRCGIPLSEEEAGHYEAGKRVTTVDEHVVRVETENAPGRGWWEPDRDDIVEYAYEGDRLVYSVARERHGRFLRRFNYAPDMSRATCTEEDGVTPRALAGNEMEGPHAASTSAVESASSTTPMVSCRRRGTSGATANRGWSRAPSVYSANAGPTEW